MDAAAREQSLAASVSRAKSDRFTDLFGRYAAWYFARNFHMLRIDSAGLPDVPPDRPAIVCSNHPSWWDPLTFILLARRFFPGRRAFGPMDSAALRHYPFMRRLGVYGVSQQGIGGAATFMFTSAGLLRDPRTVLWVTGEGRFGDVRQRPVRLRPGVAHLATRVPRAVILPLALEYPFWNERYPEALAHFGPPVEACPGAVAETQRRVEQALTQAMTALSAAAIGRDPGRFQPVLRGGTGVGGAYDVWRRAKAWSHGRRFEPGHTDRSR
jgi:1-acyl-sn-glycerol-3-phosphate acyltransferase